MEPERARKCLSSAALATAGLAVAGGIAAACAGFGTRGGLWNFRTGFSILRWAGFVETAVLAAAVVVAILAAKRRDWRAFAICIPAAAAAMAISGSLLSWKLKAATVPPIHDITTDLNTPPKFSAIVPLRATAPNPSEYPGAETAAAQMKGYPDLKTAILPLPYDRAFAAALAVARELGWKIVAESPDEGRIEASDTTFWFGFTDDVVIRITPAGTDRSLVDIRSVSRVGRSDVGTNAARIRRFLAKLRPLG
jgi:uncharacterized protein (DUF1499 family)